MDKEHRELRFLLHSVMPSTDHSWQAGFEAAQADYDLDDNPFHETDEEYLSWQAGWWSGFYEEPSLIEETVNEVANSSPNEIPDLTKIKIAIVTIVTGIMGFLAYTYLFDAAVQ